MVLLAASRVNAAGHGGHGGALPPSRSPSRSRSRMRRKDHPALAAPEALQLAK